MLNRFFVFLLVVVMCFLSAACSKNDNKDTGSMDNGNDLPSTSDWYNDEAYDIDAFLKPVWRSREIYHESVLFIGDEEKTLLYKPDEILSVRSYDLKTVYKNETDYVLTKDGKLKRTENSGIPVSDIEEFFPLNGGSLKIGVKNGHLPNGLTGERYVWLGSDQIITAKQAVVTYCHSEVFDGDAPESQTRKFTSFLNKQNNKSDSVCIQFWGDSITWGADASGNENRGEGKYAPFMPGWPEMVTSFLERSYNKDIKYINTAVGGYSVNDGLTKYSTAVAPYKSDLLVLGFGMNDAGMSPSDYFGTTKEIVDNYLSDNPDSCVLLVSPMYPNPDCEWSGNQPFFEAQLERLSMGYTNVGVAKVTNMHNWIMQKKSYQDTTSNNINHPNDFLCRIYAQTVLYSIIGDEYYDFFK